MSTISLRLPESLHKQARVLVDHVKNQHWQARRVEKAGAVAGSFVDEAADLMDALMRHV